MENLMTMNELTKELLDVYDRFESTKSAQGAMDFAMRNARQMQVPVDIVQIALTSTMQTVDLGLPSGRLWADRNVGAKSPEDPGLFFSWGNTEGVEFGKVCDFDGEHYMNSPGAKMEGDLDAEHDAARVNMGAPWCMPTEDDFVELVENCNYELVNQNGYYGMRFTSKKNGNSIFLVCSGYGERSSWSGRGSSGYYWSATSCSPLYARSFYFRRSYADMQSTNSRCFGFAVRPVQ